MQRIAITGSSGNYASKLIEHIRRDWPDATILGIDVAPPAPGFEPHEFVKHDIRSPDVRTTLEKFQPDTIMHLAFVLNPIRDLALMHDINVNGAKNVFEAVRTIQPQRFMMASSATAYGAWDDNPVPMDESWPLRARKDFQYSADKTELESAVLKLAEELPDVAVSWTRPTIIGGARVDNYLTRLIINLPVIMLLDGFDTPLQWVHEEDCAAATLTILKHSARGPFNISPSDWVFMSQVAKLTNRRQVKIPLWTVRLFTKVWWKLHLPVFHFPPSLHYFARYPWVIAPNRLTNELGFKFQYSAQDTLMEMWNAHQQRKQRK